ncbi:MAG TPA: hypothetical protein EYM29_06000 [Rhodospirillales bacterium]|jgi:hypothetical protein|nr:hypothetical protein [Rhodospirillales bacterium]
MLKRRLLPALIVSLVLVVGLGGCYMPIRFDAEIAIHRTGHYEMLFDGYLAKVELYKDLKERKIDLAEEKKQAEIIKTDLSRDTRLKEFKYLKMGHFKVNWESKGDLIKTKSVSFINSTSEYIVGVRFNKKTRRISMSGKSVKRDIKKQLDELGLGWTGQIRVFTDAKVISHNATGVKKNKRLGGRYMTYTWVVENIFAPTPSLIIQIL